MLHREDKIGIVCCSNGQPMTERPKIELLLKTLSEIGLVPICSEFIYEKESAFSASGKERAMVLTRFYEDTQIKAIFDISGGDLANEILEFLDFSIIKNNPKPFFGYSDLTTLINAIYRKTGHISYLYQIKNFVYKDKEEQIKSFINSIFNGRNDLFQFQYQFIQGNHMNGIVVGGNIRCLLKLAGTSYLPEMKRKILFFESLNGDVPRMVTYLCQLKQMNIFNEVNGIILGTFSEMEEKGYHPSIVDLVKMVINNPDLPIVKTNDIGHRRDSKCLIIGKEITLH